MVKNTAKPLEEVIRLASKKIDKVAKKFRSGGASYRVVAAQLDELAEMTRKLASDCTRAIETSPKKEREELLSGLEKSRVVNVASVVTPVFEKASLFDDCLALHEYAKVLAAQADIADIFEAKLLAALLTTAALIVDIAAQECDERHAEEEEEKLEEMEETVKRLEEKIDYIMDLPPGGVVPPVPKDETPTSLTTLRKLLEVAKKFYKFEGAFEPTFTKDKQLIRIGPLASVPISVPPIPILVTGFIDLGGMEDYDVVTITTKVLEPSPSPHYAIWRVKTFTGRQSSGLKHFQDFADLLEVPGDGVEVLIAQSASAHNFDPAFLLTIPYQFLVETTVLPQFNVS